MNRLLGLFFRSRLDRELDSELAEHLQLLSEENQRRGMSAEEARLSARRSLGCIEPIKEAYRDQRGIPVLETLWRDLRGAFRVLRKSPSYTAAAVLTLALAIGANTAVFSVVRAVILRPLPYRNPDRLAMLWTDDVRKNIHEAGTSFPTFEDWRTRNHSFEDVALCSRSNPVTLTGDQEPERVPGALISANLLPMLGVSPILGRDILPEDETSGAHVVLVSEGLWRRRFAGSAAVVGATIAIDGRNSMVVGVMPASFAFPEKDIQVWEPYSVIANWSEVRTRRYTNFWRAVARLKPGTTFSQAQADMTQLGHSLAQEFPELAASADFSGFGVRVVPLNLQVAGTQVRLTVWILFGAVFLLLMIACTNVANLVLARGMARRREIAVRAALGASRWRIVQQLVVESILLSCVGGALGVALAKPMVRALVSLGPASIPRLSETRVDFGVLVFTAATAVVSGVLFGLGPALSTSAPDQSRSVGAPGGRFRSALVVVEFALAMILLSGAGLLLRSLSRVEQIDSGFRTEGRWLLRVVLWSRPDSQRAAFYDKVLERVPHTAWVSNFFFSYNPDNTITIESRPSSAQSGEQVMDDSVSPGFFSLMGVPFLRGRDFERADGPRAPAVAVINETMARRFWGAADPVGARFKLGDPKDPGPWITVVGVTRDMLRNGFERGAVSQVFFPMAQHPERGADLVVRSGYPGFAAAVTREIHQLDKNIPVSNVSTIEQRLDEYYAPRRFETWLLSLFSVLALALSAIGVFGVVHYTVRQRVSEVGIRLALGAARGDVLSLVLKQGLSLGLAGIGLGLLGALMFTRLISSLLYGVQAHDAATLVMAGVVLAVVAAAASLIPAQQASRVDPLAALRSEF